MVSWWCAHHLKMMVRDSQTMVLSVWHAVAKGPWALVSRSAGLYLPSAKPKQKPTTDNRPTDRLQSAEGDGVTLTRSSSASRDDPSRLHLHCLRVLLDPLQLELLKPCCCLQRNGNLSPFRAVSSTCDCKRLLWAPGLQHNVPHPVSRYPRCWRASASAPRSRVLPRHSRRRTAGARAHR